MENLTLHILFKAFFGAIAFDFITGVFKSFKKGKVESGVCADGLLQTTGECIYLLLLAFINKIFPCTSIILTILLLAFIFKEGISILENLYQLGVWIPKWVKKALEVCVEKIDSMEVKK